MYIYIIYIYIYNLEPMKKYPVVFSWAPDIIIYIYI